jgi:hypothetical protein
MVVKFRNTFCPPPPQLSLHRRAALSIQTEHGLYIAERTQKNSLYCEISMGYEYDCSANKTFIKTILYLIIKCPSIPIFTGVQINYRHVALKAHHLDRFSVGVENNLF